MNKSIYQFFIFCFSVLVFLSSGMATGGSGRFLIEFGLMQKGDDCYYVCHQTREIAFITNRENKDYSFGYTIEASDTIEHKQYIILYLPSPVKRFSDKTSLGEKGSGRRVLKSKTEMFTGSFWGRFTLNETDPKGTWTIKIYVDDRLVETIEFNVQSMK